MKRTKALLALLIAHLLALLAAPLSSQIKVELENSASIAITKVVPCSVPIDLVKNLKHPVFRFKPKDGGAYTAVIGRAHGGRSTTDFGSDSKAHHVEVLIAGTWPAKTKIVGELVPAPDITIPLFQTHPAIKLDPLSLIPKASFAGRPIVFSAPKTDPPGIGEKVIHLHGVTAASPRVHVRFTLRVGHFSQLVDVSGSVIYSDPEWSKLDVTGELKLEWAQTAHWLGSPHLEKQPMTLRAEDARRFIGQLVFLEQAGDETAPWERLEGSLIDGVVAARCTAKTWDGHLLVHKRVIGSPDWYPGKKPFRQIDRPTGTGGRSCFGVQPGLQFLHTPNVAQMLTQLRLDTASSAPRRGQQYLWPDGRVLANASPDSAQYEGACWNGRIDHRLGRHGNWGKAKTWEQPRRQFEPHDWGHIALGFEVLEYVLQPDDESRIQLEAQAEQTMLMSPTSRSGPDRYQGRPWSAMAMLDCVLSEHYSEKIRTWVRGDMQERLRLWEQYPGKQHRVWPGLANNLYGRYLRQPVKSGSDGMGIGYAPWQISLMAKGVLDWLERDSSVVSDRMKALCVRMCEAVALDGIYQDGVAWRSYYVTSWDGTWLSSEGPLHTDGRANTAGYGSFLTCIPALVMVDRYGTDADAMRRARAALASVNVASWNVARWMVAR